MKEIVQAGRALTKSAGVIMFWQLETANEVPMNILHADDFAPMRRTVVRLFSDDTVTSFPNGRELLDAIAGGAACNLVIVDFEMGDGLNGLQVIEHLRKDPNHHETPIILHCSDPGDEVRSRVEVLGARFVEKPARRDTFLEAVREIMASR